MKQKQKSSLNEAKYFDAHTSNSKFVDDDISNVFNPNSREGQFLLKHIPKNLLNKRVLDIGCGNGLATVFFAKKGAKVSAIDISQGAVDMTKCFVESHKLTRLVRCKVGDIHKLPYPSNYFDMICARAVLHHADLHSATQEIYRVLKPKGRVLFSDPLGYNPFVKIYDVLISSELRSPDERRLTFNDVEIIKRTFSRMEWIGTDIASFPLYAASFLYQKVTKPKVPVAWFEDIQLGRSLRFWYHLCNTIDNLLPLPIQLFGWRIVMVCQK